MSEALHTFKDETPTTTEDRMPIWNPDGDSLLVNEIFYSIEGEGIRVGEPTTFIRLARCNLRCFFCDTEFDYSMDMPVSEIASKVEQHTARWVCLTGGEPLGQNLVRLCKELRKRKYHLHIETNGTVSPDPELFKLIEHWTVSPKRKSIAPGFEFITELKYVVGKNFTEDIVEEDLAQYVFLQPESSKPKYIKKALEILTRNPQWRLSCRVHKLLNLP